MLGKAVSFILTAIALISGEPIFTQAPSMVYNSVAGKWTISFAVSESTDVEIAVVDVGDSTLVRRLAAGRLGANPPAPFTANSLVHSIEWDGMDDAGRPVEPAGNYGVRVRAGMSVSLDKTLNPNPYHFNSLFGAALGAGGRVYVYGSFSAMPFDLMKTVREYDGEGNYLRTIFPFPGGLASGPAAAWGAHLRDDNTACPSFADPASPYPGGMIASGSGLIPAVSGNALCFQNMVSHYPNPMKWETQALDLTDFMLLADTLVRNTDEMPTIPYAGNGGPQLFTPAAEAGVFFLSGVFSASTTPLLNRTGFWQDGSVYKINSVTGFAEKWLTVIPMDSIPEINTQSRQTTIGPLQNYDGRDWTSCAAIHGIAFDDSGRIFVCNRLKQTVDVYDTSTKAFLGSFTSPYPHMIEVNRKTNEIYVLSRAVVTAGAQIAALRKYSGWRSPAVSASLLNIDPNMNYHTTLIRMLVIQTNEKPVIWLTHKTVEILRDDGDRFTQLKDFDDSCKEEKTNLSTQWTVTLKPTLYERMAMDRRTETLYFTNGWSGLYKILDWNSGAAVVCSTSSKKSFFAREVAVSPDNHLWVSEGEGLYYGPVARYTLDDYPAPAPLPVRGAYQFDSIYTRYGHALGDKGIAVSRQGQVAVCDAVDITNGSYELKVWNADDTSKTPFLKARPWSQGGGVKFDYDGNIYASGLFHAPGYTIPPAFAGDHSYITTVGAVAKFPANPSGISMGSGSVTGAIKVYQAPHSPFSGGSGGCDCRSARFDLDPYGRLFIPDGLASSVAVVDNNDNAILSFGEYGNMDDTGPGIPLGSPTSVAVSDNYIYIADIMNARLARVRMDFTLNSMPYVHSMAAEKNAAQKGLSMHALPNPFNPQSRINISLPLKGDVKLDVYSADGKLLRTLFSGELTAGTHSFTWNGADARGSRVAAGLYMYRLAACKKVMTIKSILAK